MERGVKMLTGLKQDIENLLSTYKILLEVDIKRFMELLENDEECFEVVKYYNDEKINKIDIVLETLKKCRIEEMQKMSDLQRMNIRLSKFVKEFFEKESQRTGVSQSGLINLALEQYIMTMSFAKNFNEVARHQGDKE